MSKKTKVYIAGKVTGTDLAECTMKFGKVQKELESKGYEVVNPLEIVDNFNALLDVAMRACIKALMDCDEIYLLNDWTNSDGARVEQALAHNLNMPMHFEGITVSFNTHKP